MGVIYQKPEGLEKKLQDWRDPVLTSGAISVLEKRYLLKNVQGECIETPKEMLYRVAHMVASSDLTYQDHDVLKSEKTFYDLMADRKFFPNSPTLKGAGLDINLAACYFLPVEDSREGIFIDGLYGAVAVQAYGGGTGFNFSELRPKGSRVSTTGGIASGPISFMKIFDYALGPVIAQGGTRNGANMGILIYSHPDIEEFITCKTNGGISNFNISIGIDEKFMEMVEKGENYELKHPKWNGKKIVNAKEIFDKIVKNAHLNGDPGLIFLDRLDRDNPTPNAGKIYGTNPCGEQPLLPHEACNLGSINLAAHVKDGEIDYNELRNTVHNAVHFLDNVIEINNYPLKRPKKDQRELKSVLEKRLESSELIEQIISDFSKSPIEKMVKANRKIGLGVMGFADVLFEMGEIYGSEESYKIAEEITSFIDIESKKASEKLAETRGKFPNWEGSIYDPNSTNFRGKHLKLRNATTTTIAPTGTLSILANVVGGIEVLFGIAYDRSTVYNQDGKPTLEFMTINEKFKEIAQQEGFHTEKLYQDIIKNKGSIKNLDAPEGVNKERWEQLQKIFVTAHDLPVEDHIKMQRSFQYGKEGIGGVDNAVSKTINMPEHATEEDVRQAYLTAYKQGVKGVTIYRDGSKDYQVYAFRDKKDKKLDLVNGERPEVIGTTRKQKTPHGSAFVTLNVLEEDPSMAYETFIAVGKGGKDISAIAEGFGRAVSLGLQYGAPVEKFVEQLEGIGGETQLMGGGKDGRITSLPDALAKGMADAYIKLNEGKILSFQQKKDSGNFCPDCGSRLIMEEGCQKCSNNNCGFSKC